MTPSNDFARPPETPRARLVRRAATAAAAGVTLTGVLWTITSARAIVGPSVWAATVASLHEDDAGAGPSYSSGALVRPREYERWIPVGASLGLSYSEGNAKHDSFHQVFITPAAYDAFRRTGAFPEGTMLALEIRGVASQVLPARLGIFADHRVALEIAVKDKTASREGWAYYSFGDGTEPTARAFPSSACFTCHQVHGATDNVFTQFYPRLRDRAGESLNP